MTRAVRDAEDEAHVLEALTRQFDASHAIVDPQRRCPKCGGDATLKHDDGWMYFLGSSTRMRPDSILRRCTRCDHQWYEVPLDRVT